MYGTLLSFGLFYVLLALLVSLLAVLCLSTLVGLLVYWAYRRDNAKK